MDRIVEIDIRGERVIGGGVVLGAAGSHDDVKLQMTFDNKWDGLSKKVIFQNANGENSVFVLLGSADTGTTNVWSIYVPAEPKEFEGKMRFGVKGFSVEYRELTAEPTDWATNYKAYYTESGGVYSHVTGDNAPTFSEGTYYECIETKAVMAARTEFIILPSLTDEDAEAAQEPNPTVAEQLQAGIDELESGKVDKAEGKGLSTEDYTTDEKTKLSGVAAGAQVNVLEKVKVNGTEITPSEKAVNITHIPKAALASDVQTSLGKADTAIQSHQDISGKQDKIQYASTTDVTNPQDGQIIQTADGAFWKWNESDTTWERLVVDEISADNIPYDNAISGLAQAYVQGAIDELASEKQDTLVFNTDYNASTNKAATMADMPKWTLVGEKTLTSASDLIKIDSTVENLFSTYTQFKIVADITPVDSSKTVFQPRLQVYSNNTQIDKLYQEYSSSVGIARKTDSETAFHIVFRLEKESAKFLSVRLLSTGYSTRHMGTAEYATYTPKVSDYPSEIQIRLSEATSMQMAAESTVKIYARKD